LSHCDRCQQRIECASLARQTGAAEQLAGRPAVSFVEWDDGDLVQYPMQGCISRDAAEHLSQCRSRRDHGTAPVEGITGQRHRGVMPVRELDQAFGVKHQGCA
jgi:hypothetical protein